MYDVHCHILPGIDDGPELPEDALGMARLSAADGVKTVVATPHGAQVAAHGGKEDLIRRVQEFNDELGLHNIPLKVVMGVEYMLSMELLDDARQGKAITLSGSQYVLVEIDFLQYPPYINEAIFQLQLAGLTPVLAHPERQATIQGRPDLLEGLVSQGVVSQITGGSVLGQFGQQAQRSAEQLLKLNLVHLLASDGHTATENRPPVMTEALRKVETLVGAEAAYILGVANPQAVLGGLPLTLPTIRPGRKGRFPWPGRRQ
ncbi:MAG: hypothetical protein HY532_07335 [Chloroflexi bacterium]|nr:hypothetical protein [Chloroflexota bacterium]